jgi:HPt (histidine-containing phosphotransfer) domain-containing protein
MDDYISKPVTLHNLRTTLSRWTKPTLPTQETLSDANPIVPFPCAVPADFDEARLLHMEQLFRTRPGGLYGMILEPFLASTAKQLQQLKDATKEHDVETLQVVAHAVKGSSRSLGFVGLGASAEALEQRAKLAQTTDFKFHVEAVQTAMHETVAWIESYRKRIEQGSTAT